MIVLYVTGRTKHGAGFLMEITIATGTEISVPLAFEICTGSNQDVSAMEYINRNLSLTPAQIKIESMGAREMEVVDAKTGRMEICHAYRYNVDVIADGDPNLEWTDHSGFVHNLKWSENQPY